MIRLDPCTRLSHSPSTSPAEASCRAERQASALELHLAGSWTISSKRPDLAAIRTELSSEVRQIVLHGADIQDWDSALLSWLYQLAEAAREKEIAIDASGLPEGAARLHALSLAVAERSGARRGEARANVFARIGTHSCAVLHAVTAALNFLGEVVCALMRFVTFRARYRKTDLLTQMQSCGIGALAIVSLINLLVGLILAFVGSVQLEMFGAQIYVASLVGIAIVRVMGPIMTGIILAGRTGAAFAAQIGTMQVNEEIDALETMGIQPSDYLVLPRVIALGIMTPLLCLYADLMGILGGLIVGTAMLGIGPRQYLTQTFESVGLTELSIGLIHGTIFGIWIALAGCYHGMRCGRSASAVGQAVTSAVVAGIVGIVVVTAILTLVCNTLGI